MDCILLFHLLVQNKYLKTWVVDPGFLGFQSPSNPQHAGLSPHTMLYITFPYSSPYHDILNPPFWASICRENLNNTCTHPSLDPEILNIAFHGYSPYHKILPNVLPYLFLYHETLHNTASRKMLGQSAVHI